MINRRIYLASPHMSRTGREFKNLKQTFDDNWIAPAGPALNLFEENICKYTGSENSVALSSGTSAIHLALKALDIKQGDFVAVSTLTFAASVNPIIYQGAEPIFIDSERDTWNMCPDTLRKAFETLKEENKLPKAIVIVHLYGQSAKMDKILQVCKEYNVSIIEDAAESLGATYQGKQTGTFGDYGIYSFNGNKIITTSGGGAIVTDHKEKAELIKKWSQQSKENVRHYEHKEIGYNYRLSAISASIGIGQLEILDKRIKKKKKIYETYKEKFADLQEIEMMPMTNGQPNYWLSVMTLKNTDPLVVIKALEKKNIESRPVWKPMHRQPIFEKYRYFKNVLEDSSVSDDLYNRGVCLPSDTKMNRFQLNKVIKTIVGQLS